MNLPLIGPMSSYKLLDKGSERDGADLGRTPGHDVDLQEHVRQLRRRAHHQTERFQQPSELFFTVRYTSGYGRATVRNV